MDHLSKLFWDERHSGKSRARLTPWLYAEHKSTVDAQLAMLSVTNPERYKEAKKAYEDMEAEYFAQHGESDAPETKEEDVVAEKGDKEESEEVTAEKAEEEIIEEKPKKRGRKPKTSPDSI